MACVYMWHLTPSTATEYGRYNPDPATPDRRGSRLLDDAGIVVARRLDIAWLIDLN